MILALIGSLTVCFLIGGLVYKGLGSVFLWEVCHGEFEVSKTNCGFSVSLLSLSVPTVHQDINS